MFKLSSILLKFCGGALVVDLSSNLFLWVSVILSCMFLAAFWSPAGKKLTSYFIVVMWEISQSTFEP